MRERGGARACVCMCKAVYECVCQLAGLNRVCSGPCAHAFARGLGSVPFGLGNNHILVRRLDRVSLPRTA